MDREQAHQDAEESVLQASRSLLADNPEGGYTPHWNTFRDCLAGATNDFDRRQITTGGLATLAAACIGLLRETWLLAHEQGSKTPVIGDD